jgi:hypothetical protein
MAAGQMPGFMRQNPDDLVRGLRLHQRTVIDENATAVRDEGVKNPLIEDHNLDVLLFQARSAQDWPGVLPQQLLGLGVADDRWPLFRLGQRRGHRRNGERDRGGDSDQAGGFWALRHAEQHRAVFGGWRRV